MTRQVVGLAVAMLLVGLALISCSDQPARREGTGTPITSDDRGRAEGYSLSISKIGVESTPLAPVVLNEDRTIQTPPVEFPEQAALYAGGPAPGEVGPAIVLGHVNGNGRPGVFARLGELAEGDRVATTGPRGEERVFEVYRVLTVPKADFPTAQVYSDTPGPELRLITCGGSLDSSAASYVGQVIVFARLVA